MQIHNPVSGYDRSTTTDAIRHFQLSQRALQSLSPVRVATQGFVAFAQDVDVRSVRPLAVKIGNLQVAGSSSTVTVEGGGDLVENDPTFHTDVDRQLCSTSCRWRARRRR